MTFSSHIIIPKNSDIRIVASTSAGGAGVNASFNGYLAVIV